MAPAVADAAPAMRYCGPTSNGTAVLAGPKTSCPFAKAVVRKWMAAPTVRYRAGIYAPRPGTYRVYSTVAHRYVRMYCREITTPNSPYGLCTGGNGARVEWRS